MVALITAGLYLTRGRNDAASAFLGGIVAILPGLLFARLLFRHRGARLAKNIVNDFYLGEGVKLGVSIILFGLVFECYRVSPIVFFITYSTVAISFGFLLLILVRCPTKDS